MSATPMNNTPSSTYVLTGAGAGIGRALAQRLQARGDRLILVARSPERAAQLAEEFPGARTLVADLADPASFAAGLAGQELPTTVDGLVHAAGVVELGSVAEASVADWQHQLAVNLVAPAELTRLLLPAIRAARGQVVFVNSGSGLRANPTWSAYAATKHGLKALADALRAEEEGHGVRVTTVYPGRTATAMQAKVHEQEGRAYDPSVFMDPESVASTVLTALDLPRDAMITDLSVRPGPR